MQVEFSFFLSRYQPSVFHRKTNGRPMTKLEKIKREAKKSSKLKNDHIKSRADAERTISLFVAYRTITLPFLL